MKKILLFSLGLVCLGSAYGQVSEDISQSNFERLLADNQISNNWNAVQAFSNKEKQRSEDMNAVYNKYITALQESELNDNAELKAIISKEIEAVENLLNRK